MTTDIDRAREALDKDFSTMSAEEISTYRDQAEGVITSLEEKGIGLNEDVLFGMLYGTSICGAINGSGERSPLAVLMMEAGLDPAFEAYMVVLFVIRIYDERHITVTA